jgi:ABC-type antimicrobial peptide transport system permease subunit
VDAFLRGEGYSVQSERTRVEEIQGYARTFQRIVWIVGGLVFAFGIWTLVAVLSDNTARKRGALGVLRAMGMGRWGVRSFVLGRALLIGLFAGALALPLSLLLTRVLTAYVALCELQPAHLAGAVAVAVGCCLLGGLIPAITAGFVDPGEEITNSNAR